MYMYIIATFLYSKRYPDMHSLLLLIWIFVQSNFLVLTCCYTLWMGCTCLLSINTGICGIKTWYIYMFNAMLACTGVNTNTYDNVLMIILNSFCEIYKPASSIMVGKSRVKSVIQLCLFLTNCSVYFLFWIYYLYTYNSTHTTLLYICT